MEPQRQFLWLSFALDCGPRSRNKIREDDGKGGNKTGTTREAGGNTTVALFWREMEVSTWNGSVNYSEVM